MFLFLFLFVSDSGSISGSFCVFVSLFSLSQVSPCLSPTLTSGSVSYLFLCLCLFTCLLLGDVSASLFGLFHPPLGLPRWYSGKESACQAGDLSSILGSGRSPGEGNGNPLQHSCLENPMDRGAWQATVHAVTRSWTRLSTHARTSSLSPAFSA